MKKRLPQEKTGAAAFFTQRLPFQCLEISHRFPNRSCRALGEAGLFGAAAGLADGGIDDGEEVFDLDGAVRAAAHAEAAAEAGVRAGFLGGRAFGVGLAVHGDGGRDRQERHDALRAGLLAFAAARAGVGIDDGQAVFAHVERVERARLDAGAKAEAAVLAGVRSA